ncbi:methyl-accepting chemotaxis protein [Vibrio mexicanus]|uniref:methyl-accepting chemotaxis protein n=1 Tax=Vibrio mexicanus TaxID=1004326 RepID=UPI00063BFE72|nr:methyl-accepting chemotaxis protein [Vibrio mexicanus]
MLDKIHKVSIATRAWSILVMFAVGLLACVVLDAIKTRDLMRDNYEKGVIALVESAQGIVAYYHEQSISGGLTTEQAQQLALSAISSMRFDGGNYIFVADETGVQIASGVKSLVGKNIMDLTDSSGKKFVRELYQSAYNGGGFVDYEWANPDKGTTDPKTSYASFFQPWEWMIGSGINMEALQGDIERAEWISLSNATMILIGLFTVVAFFIKTITSPLKRTVRAMENLSKGEGDLTQRLVEEGSSELRDLARYFNQFVGSIQSIMLSVSDSASQVSSSVSQMHHSVHAIDDSLAQQQNDVDQLATAMTQMLATVEEVAGRTVEANDASQLAAKETLNSQSIVGQNMEQSKELASDMHNASDVVEQLSADARNVDTVLEVIRGVAEQTNLLALNAAIEAARAGEQGRGFAVVADEVRTLSVRTQESTLEIQSIVEKLQVGSEDVVKLMSKGFDKANDVASLSERASAALNTIDSEVQTIEAMNEHIATAAEEQTVTVNDINRNVVSLRDMSASVSEESSQMASASQSLHKVSTVLVDMINRFKLA